jgi:hypothetical protein
MKWSTCKHKPGTMRVKTKFAWFPMSLSEPKYTKIWLEKYYVIEEYLTVCGTFGRHWSFVNCSGYFYLNKSDAEEYIANMEKKYG